MVREKSMILWMVIFGLGVCAVPSVAQNGEFPVTLGENKVFTTYNSHETKLEIAPFHSGQGEPSLLEASSKGQKASAHVLAESYQEGLANSVVGVDFLVEPSCKGLITTMKAEISITLTYKLDVDFEVPPPSEYGGGSAISHVEVDIMGDSILVDRVDFVHYSDSDSRSGQQTIRVERTLQAGTTYSAVAMAQSYGDVYISGYANSYAEVIVDQVKITFKVPEWRKDLQKGDILLTRSASRLANSLDYTHTAMYVGKGEIVEAFPGGVRYSCINKWDPSIRQVVKILRVENASQADIEEAVNLVKKQADAKKSFKCDWWHKDSDPNSKSWYCSELVWAAYYKQGIELEHRPDPLGVTPDEIDADYDTKKVGGYKNGWPEYPSNALNFLIHSPVDLMINDPEGIIVTKNLIQIPGGIYLEDDLDEDGSSEAVVAIPDVKVGEYLVDVIPKPDASPSDRYYLEASTGSSTTILAEDVLVSDIPGDPYQYTPPTPAVFRVTKEGNVHSNQAYYGQDFLTGGADIAEHIKVTEPVEPGDVVALDPNSPGQYRKSHKPYSTLGSGVISTQPGFILGIGRAQWDREIVNLSPFSNPKFFLDNLSLDKLSESPVNYTHVSLRMDLTLETITWTRISPSQKSLFNLSLSGFKDLLLQEHIKQTLTGKPLLALMGVVPVKATAENGPIKPGDLLTTSSKPGYVMACKDKEKCAGAIIGKALEPLEEDTGVIEMLVVR